jgi:hypothetical protein
VPSNGSGLRAEEVDTPANSSRSFGMFFAIT